MSENKSGKNEDDFTKNLKMVSDDDVRRILSEEYDAFLDMIESLYIPDNIGGRVQFLKKQPALAQRIFGEELIAIDKVGTTDMPHRFALEDEAAKRHHEFCLMIRNLNKDSIAENALNLEYIEKIVRDLGRDLALKVYYHKLVDKFLPPPAQEQPVPAPKAQAPDPAPSPIEPPPEKQLEKPKDIPQDELNEIMKMKTPRPEAALPEEEKPQEKKPGFMDRVKKTVSDTTDSINDAISESRKANAVQPATHTPEPETITPPTSEETPPSQSEQKPDSEEELKEPEQQAAPLKADPPQPEPPKSEVEAPVSAPATPAAPSQLSSQSSPPPVPSVQETPPPAPQAPQTPPQSATPDPVPQALVTPPVSSAPQTKTEGDGPKIGGVQIGAPIISAPQSPRPKDENESEEKEEKSEEPNGL